MFTNVFTVDHQANRIKAVKTKPFSELGFTERKHLQFSMPSGLRLAHEPTTTAEVFSVVRQEFNRQAQCSIGTKCVINEACAKTARTYKLGTVE